jgi:hypothetical protein
MEFLKTLVKSNTTWIVTSWLALKGMSPSDWQSIIDNVVMVGAAVAKAFEIILQAWKDVKEKSQEPTKTSTEESITK